MRVLRRADCWRTHFLRTWCATSGHAAGPEAPRQRLPQQQRLWRPQRAVHRCHQLLQAMAPVSQQAQGLAVAAQALGYRCLFQMGWLLFWLLQQRQKQQQQQEQSYD